jgi:2-iminobutanoate/2-iminopropanoate deaminase
MALGNLRFAVIFFAMISVFGFQKVARPAAYGRLFEPLYAEMSILIQGTKNAYTTLRPYDVVLYKLNAPTDDGKDRALGAFTAKSEILPLYNKVEGDSEFYIDPAQAKMSAEKLKSENRLLRVVSSDRRGQDCFIIEEYLGSDIWIPVRADGEEIVVKAESATKSEVANEAVKIVPSMATDPIVAAPTVAVAQSPQLQLSSLEQIDASIALTEAKLEIALLQSQLLQLRAAKDKLTSGKESRASLTAVKSPLAPAAVGPYSQAVVVSNGFVFVSGCVGLNPDKGRIEMGGIEAETVQALKNLRNIITQSGSDMTRVIKTTVIVRDLSDISSVNKIYSDFFRGDVLPARTTFEVAFLPLGAAIEIDAVAVL